LGAGVLRHLAQQIQQTVRGNVSEIIKTDSNGGTLEIKSGGFTLSIDGVPVTREGEIYETRLKLASDETVTATSEQRRLATFASRFAAHLMTLADIPVHFFRADGVYRGRAPKYGGREPYIKISDDLFGAELVKTALHECRHVGQHGTDLEYAGDSEREADADGFAAKWHGAVLAAFRASDGFMSNVTFRDGRPPWPAARKGDVVVSRTSGRVYSFNPFARGSAWQERACL
jgi:hypothetical protein